jgi:hypothetical protein
MGHHGQRQIAQAFRHRLLGNRNHFYRRWNGNIVGFFPSTVAEHSG